MKLRTSLLNSGLLAFALAAGCSANAGSSSQLGTAPNLPTSTPMNSPVDAQSVIAEADIIQLEAGQLYALSKLGTLSVVDVSTPGELTLSGQTTLPGLPFEMYLREGLILAMSNGALGPNGDQQPLAASVPRTDPGNAATVSVLDIREPADIATLATFRVPGEIADSRIVGDVLYLATYENARCYGCGVKSRTLVTSFDISEPTAIRQVDQLSFESNAPEAYNLAWGMHWKRSIFVTEHRLYIGGHADIEPQNFGTTAEGIIDVIDVSDPEGQLRPGTRIKVAGAILSRWQLDERDGILRVVSQKGAGRTGNGIGAPEVVTFRVESANSITPLGHTTLSLPRQEGLRTVRFDGSRAYAITYNQTDPLFVIDLHDPAHPEQRGELHMPGFMFHLEPHGDRVIGLGIDRTDTEGSLNVSLFDVSDLDEPRMLKRVAFGTPGITEDFRILDGEVSEDQDRIQKSFRVLPDGLVVVPFTALRDYRAQGSSCDNAGGGVQLVEWRDDTLRKRALLPLPGNPLRALEHEEQMITVSDSTVRTFSLSDPEVAKQTADLTIGTCIARHTGYAFNADGAAYAPDSQYYFGCSALAAHGGNDGCPMWLVLVALTVPRLRRRCRSR